MIVYAGNNVNLESPSKRGPKLTAAEKVQLQLLQQSQSAIKISNRSPDYFDFEESGSNQKTPFQTGQSKIKMKSKVSNTTEKNIYVID